MGEIISMNHMKKDVKGVKNTEIFIGVGYPLGTTFFQLNKCVVLNQDEVPLSYVGYILWQLCDGIKTKETLEKEFEESIEELKEIYGDIDEEERECYDLDTEFDVLLDELINNKHVLHINSNDISDEDKRDEVVEMFKSVSIYRQGIGMGVSEDENDELCYVVGDGRGATCCLDETDFTLWSSGNGALTLGEIAEQVAKMEELDINDVLGTLVISTIFLYLRRCAYLFNSISE